MLGAVVASTDAAAVFATLRFTQIRRRLARTLEAESGGNDPMAIALTIGLIAWIESPETEGFDQLVLLVVRQLGLGLVVGIVLAVARPVFARLPRAVGRSSVASLAAGHLVRRGRRDRRQRLPLRLPRRPRDRQHPVALSATTRRLPRRAVPRADRALHRAGTARVPARADRRRGVRTRVGTSAGVPDPTSSPSGCRPRSTTSHASGSCWAGSRRGADRPGDVRPLVTGRDREHDLQRRLLRRRRLGDAAGDDTRAGRPEARPHLAGPTDARTSDRGRRVEPARSPRLRRRTGARDRRCSPFGKSAATAAIIAVVVRGDDSIRGSTIIEPGDRLFVLVPHSLHRRRRRLRGGGGGSDRRYAWRDAEGRASRLRRPQGLHRLGVQPGHRDAPRPAAAVWVEERSPSCGGTTHGRMSS